MQSSKDARAVCRALGVGAIRFIHFKLIFVPPDKTKLINQCPGFELDPFGFNLSLPLTDDGPNSWAISRFLIQPLL